MTKPEKINRVVIYKSDYCDLPEKEEVLKAVFTKINCRSELTPDEAALVKALLEFADRLM